MTKEKAQALGWKFSGTDESCIAEKGVMMHMGKLAHVLMMISMMESK